MEEDQIIEERKRKVKAFFTNNYNWVAYVILAIIVYLSVRIRTANLSKLKDVTTGTWTLGPDLDPFLFLRWAKYIVEHGSLYVIDSMRYVPLGFPTKWELLLHPYMMAWFHKLLFALGLSDSITYSAIVYPVFFFAITVVAFFLLVRKIFVDSLGNAKSNIVALIASFFLTIIPALLPRTIAGIPEKESAAFFFLFMAFYLFLSAWKAKKIRNQIVLSVLAGAFSAGMSLVWGGSAYVFLIISPAVLISFIFGSTDKKKVLIYLIWVFSSFVLMYPFSLRYTPINLISSTTTGVSVFVLFAILVHMAIFETRLNGYYNSSKASKIPPKIFSFLVSIVLVVVLASLIFGLNFVPEKINGVLNDLVTPATSRLIQTVAENRQPYFKEWESSFGPHIKDVALTFWLFFFGSIYLFYSVIKMFSKKEKLVLTMAYFIFLFSLIFSRYSSESVFNGTNGISLMLYAAGFLVFLITTGCFYYKNYRAGQESKFVEIDFGIILLFIFFLLCVVSARGAVRLIMMLVPSASIMVGYFTVALFNYAKKATDATAKMIAWCVFCIVLIAVAFSGYTYYNVSISEAAGQAPTIYTQQWQKSMAWVRENTPQNAVFGHWWDYGYWLQSIGERATVLDGGNAQSYWNHMMGRYALTGPNNTEALEFLYAHNTTHFLIDSTDIGKYSAFSSIGSDENYDRASYLQTFLKDDQQTSETKNNTVFVYTGGFGLDGDVIYEQNGTRLFFPGGKAGIGAIIVEMDKEGSIISQPYGIFVYQGKQYNLPLRYAYTEKFVDYGSGIEAGVFIYPKLFEGDQGIQLDKEGAAMFLSSKTVKSQLARLYLYNENNSNFVLVHSEDDYIIEQVKKQYPEFNRDCIFYQGFRGAIKIWEIRYPAGIVFEEKYISTEYPKELFYTK